MKKLALYLLAAGLALTIHLPSNASAASAPVETAKKATVKPEAAAQAKVLLLRLDEIKAMDKSNLGSTDKKNLRTEVRSIQSQLQELGGGGTGGVSGGGGVYLSVGAIIIIILLLILLM